MQLQALELPFKDYITVSIQLEKHSDYEALKVIRLKTTDSIKDFISYAQDQGSSNANRYYMVFTKLQNDLLFDYENVNKLKVKPRENLDIFGADIVMRSDIIIADSLKEGMQNELPYKEVYHLVKKRLIDFTKTVRKIKLSDNKINYNLNKNE